MPVESSTSTQLPPWEMRKKDTKRYFHFDRATPKKTLERYAQDNEAVEKHAFFPLLLFTESWVKFRKTSTPKIKKRPLRYAARRDAAIYAYHRHFLAHFYEQELERRGISEIPIAYRKIPSAIGKGNKNNIDFAKDVFDFVRSLGDCDVTVVDISGFFESLDHQILKSNWEKVLGRPLNGAESTVFRSVTNYAVVDRDKVFERLGLLKKSGGANRKERRQRSIDKLKSKKHRQICTPAEFREKICGGDPSLPSLIQKNSRHYGIPQGTPISDLLANLYLIDFDTRLARWVRKRGGQAFRYCDDIIVVLPTSNSQSYAAAYKYLCQSVKNFGDKLVIKPEKVSVSRFIEGSDRQYFTHIAGASSQNGLEYLGFQFDGKQVQLKNSTLANAWRKLKRRSYGWARRWVRQHRAKGDRWLRRNAPIDFQIQKILQRVSVRETDHKKWTFNRYVSRCEKAFSGYETKFASQTKKYRKTTRKIIEKSLKKAISKHGHAACRRKKIPIS